MTRNHSLLLHADTETEQTTGACNIDLSRAKQSVIREVLGLLMSHSRVFIRGPI